LSFALKRLAKRPRSFYNPCRLSIVSFLIALLDDPAVIEKILRHLRLWPEQPAPACLSRAPPPTGVDRVIEPFFDDPFPDYNTEPVMAYAKDPDFAA